MKSMKKILKSLKINVQWQGWRWHVGMCVQLVVGIICNLIMLLTLGIVFPSWILPIVSWRLTSPFFDKKTKKTTESD
jgi:hypothetical protein